MTKHLLSAAGGILRSLFPSQCTLMFLFFYDYLFLFLFVSQSASRSVLLPPDIWTIPFLICLSIYLSLFFWRPSREMKLDIM